MPKKYVAITPIFVGTALGYAVGDDVPEDNVKVHGWQDSVEEVGSEDADE